MSLDRRCIPARQIGKHTEHSVQGVIAAPDFSLPSLGRRHGRAINLIELASIGR